MCTNIWTCTCACATHTCYNKTCYMVEENRRKSKSRNQEKINILDFIIKRAVSSWEKEGSEELEQRVWRTPRLVTTENPYANCFPPPSHQIHTSSHPKGLEFTEESGVVGRGPPQGRPSPRARPRTWTPEDPPTSRQTHWNAPWPPATVRQRHMGSLIFYCFWPTKMAILYDSTQYLFCYKNLKGFLPI